MTTVEDYKDVMKKQPTLALATAIDNQPNVRIVIFYFDDKNQTIYFTTFKNTQKVIEINQNQTISFTTLPLAGEITHVRGTKGQVKKSQRPLSELSAHFIEKNPAFKETLATAGGMLELYEMTFPEFYHFVDFKTSKRIVLS